MRQTTPRKKQRLKKKKREAPTIWTSNGIVEMKLKTSCRGQHIMWLSCSSISTPPNSTTTKTSAFLCVSSHSLSPYGQSSERGGFCSLVLVLLVYSVCNNGGKIEVGLLIFGKEMPWILVETSILACRLEIQKETLLSKILKERKGIQTFSNSSNMITKEMKWERLLLKVKIMVLQKQMIKIKTTLIKFDYFLYIFRAIFWYVYK